jgi:hypothetical protein
VTVTLGGETIAQGSGAAANVTWTWDSTGATPGHYVWTIEAGPSVRPARGSIGPPPAPPPPPPSVGTVTELVVSPAVISPNGDGFADSTTVSYALHVRAAVTAVIQDAGGNVVRTLFASQRESVRQISFPLTVDDLPDGRYNLDVSAVADDGTGGAADASFLVDRTLSVLGVSPSSFTPGAGTITFSFTLAKPAQVTLAVVQNGQPLTTLFSGPLEAGPQSIGWDGGLLSGPAAPGHYDVLVTAVDDVGETAQSAGFDVASAGG